MTIISKNLGLCIGVVRTGTRTTTLLKKNSS